ncbi:tigger transposable element-derived protein 1-like [Palaemon carinicauda]|uniref:tigger transposable element-derived protein 1-like n=1 Tax=Palaemon carinicauda TaxID=392227 RepID=UPI0035B62052
MAYTRNPSLINIEQEGEIIRNCANVMRALAEGRETKSWFEKFKRRFGLHSLPLYGEAASADQEAVLRYVKEKFPKLIKDGGFLTEQVFNMDETGLFWKSMPYRTFLYKDKVKEPGFKAHKDWLFSSCAGMPRASCSNPP